MYHKSPNGDQHEPAPSQGVNVLKPGSPQPPKALSKQTIQRLRQVATPATKKPTSR
jgi:hypothetical protein